MATADPSTNMYQPTQGAGLGYTPSYMPGMSFPRQGYGGGGGGTNYAQPMFNALQWQQAQQARSAPPAQPAAADKFKSAQGGGAAPPSNNAVNLYNDFNRLAPGDTRNAIASQIMGSDNGAGWRDQMRAAGWNLAGQNPDGTYRYTPPPAGAGGGGWMLGNRK